MNVIAINGSPRTGWNTHMLLTKALEGAASAGASTEMVNLYDMQFKGCISCLECKREGSPYIGECALNDELTPVLRRIADCGALIIGSPIYFGEASGLTRSFIERLLFQHVSYEKERKPYLERRIPTALFFTMNAPETILDRIGYTEKFDRYASLFDRLMGPARTLVSTETYQVEDYSLYRMSAINEEVRKRRREEVFPVDCQKAFDIGVELAGASDRQDGQESMEATG